MGEHVKTCQQNEQRLLEEQIEIQRNKNENENGEDDAVGNKHPDIGIVVESDFDCHDDTGFQST